MSQFNIGSKAFTAGEAMEAYRRVKLSTGSGTQVEYADAGDAFYWLYCGGCQFG